MRRTTKLFLLLGCAVVLTLEGPQTVTALAVAWDGPYGPGQDGPGEPVVRSASTGRLTASSMALLDLAEVGRR